MVLPRPAKVGGADSASLAEEMMLQPDENGVVLKGFVGKHWGTHDLLEWAREVCSVGEPARGQFAYYEGQGAEPGESFRQQLRRQLEQDLRERGLTLLQQGLTQGELLQCPTAMKTLLTLLEQLMQIHESCVQGKREHVYWKIKMELNQNGACTKYHDDCVDVRSVVTLAGDGTVLSDNAGVDWDYFDACEGAIPALRDNEDLDLSGARSIIQDWNQKVSKGELATGAGDLLIMKGGKQSKRPCLHRAPYSAGEGQQPRRFLISVDRMPQQELQEFMDMECDDSESDGLENESSDGSSADADELENSVNAALFHGHSFVFRAQRPFHPKRLDRLLGNGFVGVLRSKGLIWVAGLRNSALSWHQSGSSMRLEPGPAWLHGSIDPSDWPADTPPEYKTTLHGDRRQELVFIGKNLKEAKVRASLERALVTDAEFQGGQDVWLTWPNSFLEHEDAAARIDEKKQPLRKKSAVHKKPARSKQAKSASSSKPRSKAQPKVKIRKKPARSSARTGGR